MNRCRITTLILLTMLLSAVVAEGAPPRRGTDLTTKQPAKAPTTSLTETEQHKRYSVVSVTLAPGVGSPPSMFVLKSFYDMAKRRGAAYFVTLKEWQDADDTWHYIVGFAPDDKVDPATFFGVPPDPKKTLLFRAVKDYDLLWGSGK